MKNKNISIADSELPVMKLLWEKGTLSGSEILSMLEGNKSTIKTLLQRLVAKGAVKSEAVNSRSYLYTPLVEKQDYINRRRTGFIQKLFDGNPKNMLLNFVKEENITKEDLQQLIDMIEEK